MTRLDGRSGRGAIQDFFFQNVLCGKELPGIKERGNAKRKRVVYYRRVLYVRLRRPRVSTTTFCPIGQ